MSRFWDMLEGVFGEWGDDKPSEVKHGDRVQVGVSGEPPVTAEEALETTADELRRRAISAIPLGLPSKEELANLHPIPRYTRRPDYVAHNIRRVSRKVTEGRYSVLAGGNPDQLANVAIPEDYRPDVPCLLYTSPSPRDGLLSRMPSSA